MHLLRVRVPDFRVLKDVDITFEKEFMPRVFPLGSENGGGKSTLLQLIFVLLHCSTNPNRLPYLKNFLSGFTIPEGTDKRILAILDIWDGQKSVELEFFFNPISDSNPEQTLTSLIESLEDMKKQKSQLLKQKDYLDNIWKKLESIDAPQKTGLIRALTRQDIIIELNELLYKLNVPLSEEDSKNISILKDIKLKVGKTLTKSIVEFRNTEMFLSGSIAAYEQDLKSLDLVHIFESSSKNKVLLCHVRNLEGGEPRKFLDNLSNKVFLAAPSTQVFLFIPQNDRKSLFIIQNNGSTDLYQNSLRESKSNLLGIFTYDFLAVNYLNELFKSARDKDFKDVVETGEYGNNYKTLLNELNSLITNKRAYLKPSLDNSLHLSGVSFKEDESLGSVELYPEDLSHGELKKLSIYCWLKYKNIENAIVLMDEVDIALHPDWQYRIVDDLMEWAPSNQYILATHSYNLCEALTPSHVKILEPRLPERRSN
jgi:predicted ATP-dependent endonuclease of OLD family